MSRPVRALWIEMSTIRAAIKELESRPVRALWIEIGVSVEDSATALVEAREGLVD